MAEEIYVSVTNRNNGWTGYTIPDTGVTRNFSPSETKHRIPLSELQQLQYVAGGEELLKNYLLVDDKSALESLNMEVEPEYFYTEEEVKTLLETGSLDQLEDTLNFAPDGVIEIIKRVAVATELPDVRKRNLISEKTGLNINNAIMVNTVMNEEKEAEEETVKVRKANPISADGPVRKTKISTTM